MTKTSQDEGTDSYKETDEGKMIVDGEICIVVWRFWNYYAKIDESKMPSLVKYLVRQGMVHVGLERKEKNHMNLN